MWEGEWTERDSHSDMASEQQQMEQHFQQECERIYLYLERHVAPVDRAFVRERFLMSSESRNTAQMPLGWGGEKSFG